MQICNHTFIFALGDFDKSAHVIEADSELDLDVLRIDGNAVGEKTMIYASLRELAVSSLQYSFAPNVVTNIPTAAIAENITFVFFI